MRRRRFVAVVIATLSSTLLVPAVATAEDRATVDRVVLGGPSQSGGTPSSSLALEFDTPAGAKAVERDLETAFGPLEDVDVDGDTLRARLRATKIPTSTLTSANARTPGYHAIHCNSSYSFSDADGRFSVQRRCGSTLVPWGYKFSATLQSICVDYTVDETGLRWWRNGARQTNQSPHNNRGCGYQFHGTLNPVPIGSLVRYADDYSFRHSVGGGGNAALNINGKLEFLGSL